MISGGGSGVGVGGDESPASSPKASQAPAADKGDHEGQGVVESAKEALAGAAQSAKEAVGL
ncbi:autophagy-related 9A [Chlorella sorokiniana]|uniref:Autophagy-related 9A n=1 Tax=Chlorella sorokiniana TaxID=3076 RepID=A0A2P6U088_CHLSO|nr:autophagy-related 9A [Chlorella sorokiniana]|eukprot:PRW59724.1 autophagy-related 9A [Chlorella sorokiniana]